MDNNKTYSSRGVQASPQVQSGRIDVEIQANEDGDDEMTTSTEYRTAFKGTQTPSSFQNEESSKKPAQKSSKTTAKNSQKKPQKSFRMKSARRTESDENILLAIHQSDAESSSHWLTTYQRDFKVINQLTSSNCKPQKNHEENEDENETANNQTSEEPSSSLKRGQNCEHSARSSDDMRKIIKHAYKKCQSEQVLAEKKCYDDNECLNPCLKRFIKSIERK